MPKETWSTDIKDWKSNIEGLKYKIDRYRKDAKENKLGPTEISKEITNISHTFMNQAANAYPQIVGWSKNLTIYPGYDFFISVKCRSGFILPIKLEVYSSGKMIHWYVKSNWLKTQLKRELPGSDHSGSYDMNILMKKITKFTNSI
jgi:hypothetical protein